MTRSRARMIAISIVACTVIGATIAVGAVNPGDNYEITDSPTTTRGRLPLSITRGVLSIRNISSVTRTFSLTEEPTSSGCLVIDPVRIGGDPSITNVTLLPGQQAQFETSSLGSGVPFAQLCTFTIQEAAFTQQFDTSHTYVATQTDFWDMQPRVLSFRPSPGDSESQTVYVQNYSSSGQSYSGLRLAQTGGTPGALAFENAGLVSCTPTDCMTQSAAVAGDAFTTVGVRCTPMDADQVTGTLELVSDDVIQTTQISCGGSGATASGIALSPATLALSMPPTGAVMVTSTGTGGNTVTQAVIMGGDADFVFASGGPCTGIGTQTCNPMAGATTPVSLQVQCTPSATTRTATLVVTPAQGFDQMSVIQCVQTSTGPPMLLVSPTTVLGGNLAVGSAHTEPVTLTNIGAGTLDVHVVPPASAEWTVMGCPVSAPCSLVGNGSNTTVMVTFTPTAHDDRSSSMLVITDGGMMTNVTLTGSGTGAVLEVTAPTGAQGYTLDFGTVGLNTQQTRAILLRNNGNELTSATLGMAAGAPFTLSTSAVSLSANPAMDSLVAVTCESPTAIDETRSITITKALNTYRAEPASLFQSGVATVSAHCKVVNTEVQISPELDFKEVWKGSPAKQITATIRNPSAVSSALVTGISLVGGAQGLTLGPIVPAVSFPHLLAPGAALMTTLTLATSAEVDVGMARLRVEVDDVDLEQPISGKVVTPSARLAPASRLDLGTACVGSDVRGTVMLINDGTATLTIMRPLMDGAFTPTYVDPTTYSVDGTALLAPARSAVASVRPSMMAGAGRLTGTLTWNVAGPGPFTIDVFLSYISVGAAVSPGGLSFGPVSVDQTSNRQTITLENCNPTPIDVAVQGLEQRAGDIRAWDVQPRVDMRTLAPEEKMTISVAFAPTRLGRHAADLLLVVGGEPRVVPLEADGVDGTVERSSFYACSCQGARAPLHGWPVAIALALVCVPRRRRRR